MKTLKIQTIVLMTEDQYQDWMENSAYPKELIKDLNKNGSVQFKRDDNSMTMMELIEND